MPNRLNSYFNSSRELEQITSKARQLVAMQNQLGKLLPTSISKNCEVIAFDQSTLTLAAKNGAIASKLRQMNTDIVAKLQKFGYQVTLIQIVVQVSQSALPISSERRVISSSGKQHLIELAEILSDSPLKEALARLSNFNK